MLVCHMYGSAPQIPKPRISLANVLVAATVLVWLAPDATAAGAGKLGQEVGQWLVETLPELVKAGSGINDFRKAMGITGSGLIRILLAVLGAVLAVLIIVYSTSPPSKDPPAPTTASTPPPEPPETTPDSGTFVGGLIMALGTYVLYYLAFLALLLAVFLFTLFTGC